MVNHFLFFPAGPYRILFQKICIRERWKEHKIEKAEHLRTTVDLYIEMQHVQSWWSTAVSHCPPLFDFSFPPLPSVSFIFFRLVFSNWLPRCCTSDHNRQDNPTNSPCVYSHSLTVLNLTLIVYAYGLFTRHCRFFFFSPDRLTQ